MTEDLAQAQVTVAAPPARVWATLTDPDLIEQYMFGSRVETDWRPGSPIVWKGEYEGKAYEDRGTVMQVMPLERLEVTHFSPMSGQEDVPENYHTLVYELSDDPTGTKLVLCQDGNSSPEEARQNSQNWQQMLDGLKQVAEGT